MSNERTKIAKAWATKLLKPQLRHTAEALEPLAILVAGQPGSGKSTLAKKSQGAEAGSGGLASMKEGAVRIDPDQVRWQLREGQRERPSGEKEQQRKQWEAEGVMPKGLTEDEFFEFATVMRNDDWETGNGQGWWRQQKIEEREAEINTMDVMFEMLEQSMDRHRNLILEGTFQNGRETVQLMNRLREHGYQVAFHGLAISTELSLARIYHRYELERQTGGGGDGSTVHYADEQIHDEAVIGLNATVRGIERQGASNQIVIHYLDGQGEYQQMEWDYDELRGGYARKDGSGSGQEEQQGRERRAGEEHRSASQWMTAQQNLPGDYVTEQVKELWQDTLEKLEARKAKGEVEPEEYQMTRQTCEVQRARMNSLAEASQGLGGKAGSASQRETHPVSSTQAGDVQTKAGGQPGRPRPGR